MKIHTGIHKLEQLVLHIVSVMHVGTPGFCDSGASSYMTPSADCMINLIECDLKLRIADGSTRSIEGYGGIRFVFRSGKGLVQVLLTNVAHVPDLRYHLFSLPTLVKNGHAFEGRPTGIVVKLRSERSIVFPLTGTLYRLYGYRVDCSSSEIHVMYSPRDNCPRSPRLTSTTTTVRPDTPRRYYYARPRSSK